MFFTFLEISVHTLRFQHSDLDLKIRDLHGSDSHEYTYCIEPAGDENFGGRRW